MAEPGDRPPPSPEPGWGAPTERAAAWAFAAILVAAAATLRWHGRHLWFDIDDWGFLTGRGTSVDDLLESWNQHWCTIPILVYRGLWSIVGIQRYWPYQALTIVLHLASALMLRTVMRRAGAHPWVATAAASLFALLGSGNENMVKAFQITFGGSLAMGLAHLLLADHDGGLDRRDALGLAFGLAGLLCSGIAVPMVTVVGLATLVRRGWRIAAVHTVPLAAIYGWWWSAYRGEAADQLPTPSARTMVGFTVDLLVETVRSIGHLPGAGAAIALAGAGGILVLALAAGDRSARRRRLAAPAALAVGSLPLAGLIAWGRSGVLFFGEQPPVAPRYVHLTAAMLLPAMAVGLSELVRRWRPMLAVAITLLVVGIPGNVAQIDPKTPVALFDILNDDFVLTVAQLAETSPVADDRVPISAGGSFITVGWLRDGRASGQIPDPPPSTTPAVRARAELAMAIMPVDGVGDLRCTPVPAGPIELARGDRLRIAASSVVIRRQLAGTPPPSARFYGPGTVLLGIDDIPLVVTVEPAALAERCR